MSANVEHRAKTGPGFFLLLMIVPFGFMVFSVLFQIDADGTCPVNRPPCGDLSQIGGWPMAVTMIVGLAGFLGWAIRSASGGKERRRALASGTPPVVGRLLAIDGPKGYVGESPQMALEVELPDSEVISDLVEVPLGLMAQLIPGAHVPILLAEGGYFNLDTDAMSRVPSS